MAAGARPPARAHVQGALPAPLLLPPGPRLSRCTACARGVPCGSLCSGCEGLHARRTLPRALPAAALPLRRPAPLPKMPVLAPVTQLLKVAGSRPGSRPGCLFLLLIVLIIARRVHPVPCTPAASPAAFCPSSVSPRWATCEDRAACPRWCQRSARCHRCHRWEKPVNQHLLIQWENLPLGDHQSFFLLHPPASSGSSRFSSLGRHPCHTPGLAVRAIPMPPCVARHQCHQNVPTPCLLCPRLMLPGHLQSGPTACEQGTMQGCPQHLMEGEGAGTPGWQRPSARQGQAQEAAKERKKERKRGNRNRNRNRKGNRKK